MESYKNDRYRDLQSIFMAGVERVDPSKMVENHLFLDGDELVFKTEQVEKRFDLKDFRRIVVIGAGKATAKMALGLEKVLGDRIDLGLISVKRGHTEKLKKIETIEAGHPVPDENSVLAAKRIADICASGDENTLFINLISGGGSALLCLPLSVDGGSVGDDLESGFSLTLEDKQKTTEVLLASGAAIQEVNCIRKHISGIKGGRLAELMYPSVSLNLILSDVVGDRLDAIASGLTAPDETSFREAMNIIEKYAIERDIPPTVYRIIKAGVEGKIPETPKRGDRVFERVHNLLIGNNLSALLAAKNRAIELGYNTIVLSSRVVGDVESVASLYLGIALDESKYNLLGNRPLCIIGGGETTVVLKGNGLGGRNQEMALRFLKGIDNNRSEGSEVLNRIYFLSAGSDGNDGPTDAAGAFASLEVLNRAKVMGLEIDSFLINNDSYNFFSRIGALLKTGPTNTNVCDIQVLIVE